MDSKIERFWSESKEEYGILQEALNDREKKRAFEIVINELLIQQLHALLVAMDGGEWISEKYDFQIIEKDTTKCINADVALHEKFIDYLWEGDEKSYRKS